MPKLNADTFDLITSEPDKPIRFKTFTRGDDVTGLSPEREKELTDAGVLVESLERAVQSGPPGDSKPPKGAGDTGELARGTDVDYRTEPSDPLRVPQGPSSSELTPAQAGDLTGADLDAALEARGLDKGGRVADKQRRLVESLSR